MRKEMLGGIALALIGMGFSAGVQAKDWRACVVGACLKTACGNNDASVVVSMATNVDDPAVGGTSGLLNILLGQLQMRNQPMSGEPMMQCSPSQPTQAAADELSHNIFAQMKTSFSDVTLRSPNDMIAEYDTAVE